MVINKAHVHIQYIYIWAAILSIENNRFWFQIQNSLEMFCLLKLSRIFKSQKNHFFGNMQKYWYGHSLAEWIINKTYTNAVWHDKSISGYIENRLPLYRSRYILWIFMYLLIIDFALRINRPLYIYIYIYKFVCCCILTEGLKLKMWFRMYLSLSRAFISFWSILTHLPWTNWPPFWQTTNSNAFSLMQMIDVPLVFHWNLFPGVQLTISQH